MSSSSQVVAEIVTALFLVLVKWHVQVDGCCV
jgi:hypothetical protein